MSQNTPRRISKTEVRRSIEDGVKANDQTRLQGLNQMRQIRSRKLKLQQREQTRLQQKYDSQHERVRQVDQQLTSNVNFVSALQMEATRAGTAVKKPKQNSWVVQGYVYDREGCAVANADVALYRQNGDRVDTVPAIKTDQKGYYQLSFARSGQILDQADDATLSDNSGLSINTNASSGGEQSTTGTAGLSRGLRINTNVSQAVLVRANLADNTEICADSTLVSPRSGTCSYRDLVLNTNVFKKSQRKDRRSSRYLGNSATRELHDIKNEKPRCQIDAIRFDHCIAFSSQKEAVAADYDFCAYCFGKDKSKR
jgi:hypothetical protein